MEVYRGIHAPAPSFGMDLYKPNFVPEKIDLPSKTFDHLRKKVVERLQSGDEKLMVTAYANPTDISEVSARRIALSRGLLIREFLISEGIPAQNIDLKAVSAADNTPEGLTPDRAELYFLSH